MVEPAYPTIPTSQGQDIVSILQHMFAPPSTAAPSAAQVPDFFSLLQQILAASAPGQQQAVQPQMPRLTGKVLGTVPVGIFKGRPIVETEGGGYSTIRALTAGFGGKTYIIPTMYSGKEVTEDEAIELVRKNKFIDPDTGRPLPAFDSDEEAETARQKDHDEQEQAIAALLGRR
jgi:hypothetical protein